MLVLCGVFHNPGRTVLLTSDYQTELPELSCERCEEADTRMFARITYCVQYLHYRRVVVMANDTDLIMMCIYYNTLIAGLNELCPVMRLLHLLQ